MEENKNTKCDPCEQRFEEGIDQIVDQVEGYTREEHTDKEREVTTAFDEKDAAGK